MNKTKLLGPLTVVALGVGSLGLAACSPAAPATTTAPAASSGSAPASSPASPKSSHSSSASSSSSSSSDGSTQTVTGNGYTFEVPSDWVTVDHPAVDKAYKAPKAENGFFTNVVTSLDDPKGTSLDAGTEATAQQLEKEGATDIEKGSTTLDGEEATTLSFMRTQDGVQVRQEHVLSIHEGKLYIITASMNGEATSSDMADVVDPVVGSWQWE